MTRISSKFSRFLVLSLLAALLLTACNQQTSGGDDDSVATNNSTANNETGQANTPVTEEDQESGSATSTPRPAGDEEEETSTTEDGAATATPGSTLDEEDASAESTDEPAPSPEEPAVAEDPNERMLMVPGGTFPMGGDAEEMLNECRQFTEGCLEDWFTPSEPEHLVTLDPFYIDPYEVTNAEYLAFLNTLGTHEGVCFGTNCFDPNFSRINVADSGVYTSTRQATIFPVLGVTWFGAAAYCQWRGARLPTEAEWEMAAGWNPETESKTRYPWGDVFDGDIVSFCDVNCQADQSNPNFDDGWIIEAPVGSYEEGRSPIGAYDMAGNLWEWVADWFSETYYAESSSDNPRGPSEGERRVVRGGSWFDTGNFTSTLVRFPITPDGGSITIGFRCARDAESETGS